MATAESVKAKLQSLIDTANDVTGNDDTNLTDAVNALVGGFGGESESFPQKFYETDFVMDSSVTANGVICTIETGLSDDMVTVGNELVFAVITCTPSSEPATKWVKKVIQFITPNQGSIQSPPFGFYVEVLPNQSKEFRKPFSSGVGAYMTAVATDLSSITVNARFNLTPPTAGTYHFELYRMGVTV